MKKLLFSLLAISILTVEVKAQMIVSDVGANLQLTQQTIIQNLMKGFTKIQTNIANDALDEGVKHTDFLNKQFTLLDNVYKVSNTFNNLKRVRTYFTNSAQVMTAIGKITNSLTRDGVKYLNPQERMLIKKRLDGSLDDIKYSLELVTFAMNPGNKLSLAERLKEIDEANNVLGGTASRVAEAEKRVNRYRYTQEIDDKKKKLNTLLYQ